MTKVVKCLACGSFYNGQVYSVCPHCQSKTEATVDSLKKPVTKEDQEKQYEAVQGKGWKESPLAEKAANEEKRPREPHEENVIPVKKPGRYGRVTVPYERISAVFDEESPRKEPVPQRRELQEEKPNENETNTETENVGSDKSDNPQKQQAGEPDLRSRLRSRTVGKYMPGSGGEATAPVVGWLVCVKGTYWGQSFPLHSGKNKIGRSYEMDVKLLDDESVSRTCVAVVAFDAKAGAFSVLAGDSDSLCYVDGEAIYERRVLKGHEKIELGDSERNMFVFVPLCNEQFDWSTYPGK